MWAGSGTGRYVSLGRWTADHGACAWIRWVTVTEGHVKLSALPQPACQGVLMQLFVSSLLSKRVDVRAELAGSWAPVITTVFLGAHHLLDQSQN